MDKKKFKKKNKEAINAFNDVINDDNVRKMVMSPELACWLSEIIEDFIDDGMFNKGIAVYRYNKVRILADPYHPSNKIGVIYKTNNIEFNVPCICGVYKGEPHNLGLK